jgi:SAM-dependent methyltransferase
MTDREPTSHERMSGESWDDSYIGGPAPWDIAAPQPAIARLVARHALAGPVLDAGCGVGDNALAIAESGIAVLGFDVAETALEIARAKAAQRGLDVEFIAADALALERLGRTFETVVDSGLFHTFDAGERRRYARSLAGVTKAGAKLYIVAFGDEGDERGPHPISRRDIASAFDVKSAWNVIAIEAERVMTRFHGDAGVAGWLITAERRSATPAPAALRTDRTAD